MLSARKTHGLRWIWAVLLLSGLGSRADAKPPATKIEVIPGATALRPGRPLDVAFKFDIPSKWHIYWKNSGDSGMPPKVTWDLPEGFTAGELQHPAPRRYELAGLVTFIHDGQPILLSTVQPPQSLSPGDSVAIQGELRGLVCKERCIPIRKTFKLTLPVAASDDEVKPNQPELFEAARFAFPKSPQEAKYVKVQPRLLPDRPILPRSTFKLAVVLDIAQGYHLQSHTPLSPNFIATDVFLENTEGIAFEHARFPPHKVRNLGKMKVAEYSGRIQVEFDGEADNTLPPGPLSLAGVVTYQACDQAGRCFAPQNIAWSLEVPTATAGTPPPQRPDPEVAEAHSPGEGIDGTAEHTLLWWLFAAMAGGLILNIMPCVLPVISIKILSFVQQAGEDRRRVFQLGLAFSAGILVSFGILAIVVILLQRVGQEVGWGFQLSNPTVVIVMSAVIFVFGLSLFGVFEFNLPGRATARLSAHEAREGMLGSFMKGVLATVLATPCTAPFLGSAVGYALQQEPGVILLMLLAVGFGMALPYVLLTAQPGWMRFLPRPGPWMERFKQLMGFVLMGTVVWLLHILASLVDTGELTWTLAFLCFLGLACWVIGMVGPQMSAARQLACWSVVLVVLAGGGYLSYGAPSGVAIKWEPWEPDIGTRLADEGYTVYLDYTATWCATCQTNKLFVLETDAIRRRFQELGVRPVKADYTRQPPAMTAELKRHDRQGVPLNLIIPANRPEDTIVMPEILTTDIVLNALEQAGASSAPPPNDAVARRP